MVEHRDRFAEVLDQVQLMAGEQDDATALGVTADDRGQEPTAAGELLDLVRRAIGQSQLVEQRHGFGVSRLRGHAPHTRQPHQVLEDHHVAIQAAFLGHVPARAAVLGRGGEATPPD